MSDFKGSPDLREIGQTVRRRAADELRSRIITGRLAPGTRLSLDQITAEFGTSRTPVREALLELAHEGLVTVAPRSGITVIGVTADDAVDNFELLATLSGKAAEWAARRVTGPEVEELEALAGAVSGTGSRAGDVVGANFRFHRAVNRAARSPRLLTFIRMAVRAVPADYFELFPEQEQRSRADHAELLAALRCRDGEGARRVAEEHVRHAGLALGDWLRSGGAA